MESCTPECCSLEYHKSVKVKSEDDETLTCPWWINSKDHDNHFWLYILDKSSGDGSMSELNLHQIGRLMGWPSSKTTLMWNEAFRELSEKMIQTDGVDLLSRTPSAIGIPFSDIQTDYTSDGSESE